MYIRNIVILELKSSRFNTWLSKAKFLLCNANDNCGLKNQNCLHSEIKTNSKQFQHINQCFYSTVKNVKCEHFNNARRICVNMHSNSTRIHMYMHSISSRQYRTLRLHHTQHISLTKTANNKLCCVCINDTSTYTVLQYECILFSNISQTVPYMLNSAS